MPRDTRGMCFTWEIPGDMKNIESFTPDFKELGLLMLGFLPWMLFLFLSGHTMLSLKIAVVISLVASVTLGFGDLKRGFILSWGTCIFFFHLSHHD